MTKVNVIVKVEVHRYSVLPAPRIPVVSPGLGKVVSWFNLLPSIFLPPQVSTQCCSALLPQFVRTPEARLIGEIYLCNLLC